MIQDILGKKRDFFSTGITKDVSFRIQQLKLLREVIKQNQAEILAALKADLGKPPFEAYGEILLSLQEINYALKHIRTWVKPRKAATPLSQFLASSSIYKEPLGIVLVISPWNYPFMLAISPLVGAIAAGNCVILKPSEIAIHTSNLLAKMISENFNQGCLTVIEGGIETSQALLAEPFDHIFFTGGTAVGKLVMAAAAQHLTPVTLELGGKSPCIVDAEVDVEVAAKRITWGKFLNAGQTCIAPDYVLVHKSIKAKLLAGLKKSIREFYGEDPHKSSDYARIINGKHFSRLANFLQEGEVIVGGETNAEDRYIAPTVIDRVQPDHKIMTEEIFGPILPILEYEDLIEAIAFVNSKPKPLALYFFSTNKKHQELILRETSFGGGCINDTIVHLSTPELPFGGVGYSGMGSYHGQAGFDRFSHHKSVLHNSFMLDLKWRYPPYKLDLNFLKWLL